MEGGGRLVGAEGVVAFRGLVGFSCDAPGEPSVCPPGNDPRRPGRYTEWQVAKRMQAAVGPDIALDDVRLVGTRIEVEGSAPTSQAAVAAIETLVADRRLYRASVTGHGPVHAGARVPFQAQMELVCARPPTGEGICGVSESEP